MARIELDGVSLAFHVRKKAQLTLKEWFLKRMWRGDVNPLLTIPALQSVSFRVEQGERVGVVGHNGAGKSTLLKLLAGIYTASEGRCIVDGRISSLFDIHLGFESEATGWENIRFRSYLQGETRRSVRRKEKAIAEFSELGDDFLNMPVRFYSGGMLVRLAFSIATAIDPEILLVDEVLSAGDLNFQHKARTRMRDMMARAHLVVMVSHDLDALERVCDRLIWMDHGRVRGIGTPAEIIAAYREAARPTAAQAA